MSGSMDVISARRSREGIPGARSNLDVEAGNARLSSAIMAGPVWLVPGTYKEEFLSEFLSPKKVLSHTFSKENKQYPTFSWQPILFS